MRQNVLLYCAKNILYTQIYKTRVGVVIIHSELYNEWLLLLG